LRQPTSSHHLRKLVRSGIVEREQREPHAYFRVAPDALSRLRAIFGGRPPRVRGGDGAHPGRWRGRHNEPGGNPGGRAAEHDVTLKLPTTASTRKRAHHGIRPSARVSSNPSVCGASLWTPPFARATRKSLAAASGSSHGGAFSRGAIARKRSCSQLRSFRSSRPSPLVPPHVSERPDALSADTANGRPGYRGLAVPRSVFSAT
jgi:hypothetical protein